MVRVAQDETTVAEKAGSAKYCTLNPNTDPTFPHPLVKDKEEILEI